MDLETESILANLKNTGCSNETLKTAEIICGGSDQDEKIRFLRKYRCSLMEKVHEYQRHVDCLDCLIRRMKK